MSDQVSPRRIFIAGGTGYLGTGLIPQLIRRGHEVSALVRPESAQKLPTGCRPVIGNALDRSTFGVEVKGADTFVQLVGVPKPSPWKGAQFRAIDLVSARASLETAKTAAVNHFVYVSVAHPAPIMKAYIEVRTECEAMIRTSRLRATFLRPWYILGPGHRWPLLLLPAYRLMSLLPSTREAAARLGLVTVEDMLATLVWAIEHPPEGIRIIDVPEIRRLGSVKRRS